MVARQIVLDFGPPAGPPRSAPSSDGRRPPEAVRESVEASEADAVRSALAEPERTRPELRAASPAPTAPPRANAAAKNQASEQLESALREALPVPVRVTLTDNRRTMISLQRRPRAMHVRLHHMFASADATTLQALGLYLAEADRDAARQIGRFIEQHRQVIRRRSVRPLQLSTRGEHHDLLQIYAEVNARYFGSAVEAQITWSRDGKARRESARSIKLGSYTARDKLIRVHPALDAEFVPRFFVEYIVYHEMLHHVLPARRAGRRRCLHGADFVAREREFERFEEALEWERKNLDRLLCR
jgi:hypothetical protein